MGDWRRGHRPARRRHRVRRCSPSTRSAPRKGRLLLVPSFFASWLTIELAPWWLCWQVVVGALLVAGDGLSSAQGWVGLGLLGVVDRGARADHPAGPAHDPPDLGGDEGPRARSRRHGADVPAQQGRVPVPDEAVAGDDRRAQHRLRRGGDEEGQAGAAAPRRHQAGRREARRQAPGHPPDPRRRMGDRRQARAGPVAASATCARTAGSPSTPTTGCHRRSASPSTSSTASGPSPGGGSTRTSTAATPTTCASPAGPPAGTSPRWWR